jgi:hypothetical protein
LAVQQEQNELVNFKDVEQRSHGQVGTKGNVGSEGSIAEGDTNDSEH